MAEGKKRGLVVADVMTREVTTLRRNDQLTIADDLMKQKRIRHLPVLDADDALAGIVSQRDLFHGALVRALGYGASQQQRLLSLLVVKEVMATDVLTTTPETPLAEAARTMVERKVGCLPVMDGDRLVGILTEGDFVALATRSDATP
jgi:CBS domain-containing protein